jgi:hypothetical protein
MNQSQDCIYLRKNEIKHNKKNPLEEEITTNFYNFIYIETLFVV